LQAAQNRDAITLDGTPVAMSEAPSITLDVAGLDAQVRVTKAAPRAAWLLPFAALLVPMLALGGGAWIAWQNVWADARQGLARSADAAAAYAGRSLDSYVVAAGRVNDLLRGLSDADIVVREAELHRMLVELVQELPQAEAAYVVDRDGFPLLGASVFPVPRDRPTAVDRDFFLALSGPAPPPVHLSQIYVSRFDGKLFFAISRARVGAANGLPPGRFDGLVNLSVFPETLAVGLRRLLDTPSDAIALIRDDGHYLARTDSMETPLPPLQPGHFFRGIAAAETPRAIADDVRGPRGERRLVALRRLDGFPAYATASRARGDIVAQWRERVTGYLLLGVPATLALLLLSLRIRRARQQLVDANAALEAALSNTSARLRQAQEAGGVYPFEVGSDGKVLCDAGMRTLFGVPANAGFDVAAMLGCVHPADRARIAAEQRRFARCPGPFEVEFRVLRRDGSVRWVLCRGEALGGAARRPSRGIGVSLDITALKETEAALAESETRLRVAQEAGGIGSWEWEVRTGRLRWTAQTFALFGFDPAAGEPNHEAVRDRRHPEDRARLDVELAAAVRTGRLETEYRILRPLPDDGVETVWIATQGRTAPLSPERGLVMSGVHRDITARKRAEEHVTLLAREVEHRSKNALAVVQATLRLTKAATHDEYVRIVADRVAALSRAHNLFADRGQVGADLRALLEGELLPFAQRAGGSGPHVELSGPEVTLSVAATQPLAMVIHELATNAAKHGAFSLPTGIVSVAWARHEGGVRLTWAERGGPPLAAEPSRTGFGTRVIEQTVRRQMSGELDRNWDPAGITVEMRFPYPFGIGAA